MLLIMVWLSVERLFPFNAIIPCQAFTRFVYCFTKSTLSTFFCSDQIIAKIMHFQSKTNFFFQLIANALYAFCYFVYISFHRCFFHSSAVMRLRIASFYVSHPIMWHSKRIYGHGLKIKSACCFYGFWGNQFRGWYYLHNFKLLTSFRPRISRII